MQEGSGGERGLPRLSSSEASASAASAAPGSKKLRKRGSRGSKRGGARRHGGTRMSESGDLTPVNTNEAIIAMHEHDSDSYSEEDDDLEGVDAYLDKIASEQGGAHVGSGDGDDAILLLRPKDVLVHEILSLRQSVAQLEARAIAAEQEVAILRAVARGARAADDGGGGEGGGGRKRPRPAAEHGGHGAEGHTDNSSRSAPHALAVGRHEDASAR